MVVGSASKKLLKVRGGFWFSHLRLLLFELTS